MPMAVAPVRVVPVAVVPSQPVVPVVPEMVPARAALQVRSSKVELVAHTTTAVAVVAVATSVVAVAVATPMPVAPTVVVAVAVRRSRTPHTSAVFHTRRALTVATARSPSHTSVALPSIR